MAEPESTKNFPPLCVGGGEGASAFLKQRSIRSMDSSKAHYFGKWVNAPWPVPPTVYQLQKKIGLQGFIDSCVCACQRQDES